MIGGARRDGSIRWTQLNHNGVGFPDFAIGDRSIEVFFDNVGYTLNPSPAQTLLYEYYKLGGNCDTLLKSKTYANNFWKDWCHYIPFKFKKFKSCDITAVKNIVFTKPESLRSKYERIKINNIDNHIYPWQVDKPGIFIGQSKYKYLTGCIRRRLTCEDVTINISMDNVKDLKNAQSYKSIIQIQDVDWIARWRDPVTKLYKYSRFNTYVKSEQMSIEDRFDIAYMFHNDIHEKLIHMVQNNIMKTWSHEHRESRSHGENLEIMICIWLILKFGIRVGKRSSETANVYGATTLLKKHIKISKKELTLRFLGKSGILYHRCIHVGCDRLINIIDAYISKIKKEESLFQNVNCKKINDVLASLHVFLSAKVIRTSIASAMFQSTLESLPKPQKSTETSLFLKIANLRAAIFLNHKKHDMDDICNNNFIVKEICKMSMKELNDYIRQNGILLNTARQNYIDPRIEYEYIMRLSDDIRIPLSKLAKTVVEWKHPSNHSYDKKKFIDNLDGN